MNTAKGSFFCSPINQSIKLQKTRLKCAGGNMTPLKKNKNKNNGFFS